MPKTLMLMRHGDYADGHLNARGAEQSDIVAGKLVKAALVPDVIIHSPLPRAVETAQRVRDVFNAVTGRDIPLVSHDALSEGRQSFPVSEIDEGASTALAVSHMPNIVMLYNMFSGGCTVPDNAQTYVIEAPVDSWRDFKRGHAAHIFLPYD